MSNDSTRLGHGQMHSVSAKLQHWVRRISDQDMPVFAHTANAISTASDEASAPASLAQIILQDASLTSHVLRLANSAYYRLGNDKLNTISRAIIVLGFVRIRAICLSVATIEALSMRTSRTEVEATMATSFHAAALAEALAGLAFDESPEEVFTATLLYRIGELAFWCFAEEELQELQSYIGKDKVVRGRAETQVLGFRLKQLSAALAREWKLSSLLQEAFQRGGIAKNSRSKLVLLGHQLADGATIGWESDSFIEALRAASLSCRVDPEQLKLQLWKASTQSRLRAEQYGGVLVSSRIPVAPTLETDAKPDTSNDTETSTAESETNTRQACPLQQLRMLREIAIQIEECGNRISLLTMILEGIYRGVALERVLYVSLEESSSEPYPSFSLGCKLDAIDARFWQQLAFSPQWSEENSPHEAECFWVEDLSKGFPLNPQVKSYFVASIVENGKVSGLLYADASQDSLKLDAETFSAFKHFALQATHGLQYLHSRN